MNQLCFLTNLSSSEWAAWVQAVGSIAAIALTATLVFVQHMLEKQRDALNQRETDRRLLTIALSVARDAKNVAYEIGMFRSAESGKETGQHRQGFRQDVELALESARALHLMQLPTASAVTSVVRIQSELKRALRMIDSFRESTGTSNEPILTCGNEYGQPWLSVHANIKDQVTYLEWELRRLDNPAEPHPTE